MSKQIVKLNSEVQLDLPELLVSRLLLQANSGGGKSWAIRRIVEQSFGKTQIIIIDVEGEFSTLREKYDFVLAGKDGDTPADPRSAALLARKLLELKVSAIIDIYELHNHDKRQFVKLFLESLVNAPKTLWPLNFGGCLVIVDEAHRFAPERGATEALLAVESLTSLGRKRGLCAILATQRISKLHKDAAAECNNKMIGRTGLDIDMKRAGEELGFTSKEQNLSLRNLEPGEFYVFGTAIAREVKKIKIGEVHTTHAMTKMQKIKLIPPTEKIKALLPQLSDLPAEARKEAMTMAELKTEIVNLKRQLSQNPQKIVENELEKALAPHITAIESERNAIKLLVSQWEEYANAFYMTAKNNGMALVRELEQLNKNKPSKIPAAHYKKPQITTGRDILIRDQLKAGTTIQYAKLKPQNTSADRAVFDPATGLPAELKVQGGALRMLKVLVSRYPVRLTRAQLGTFAKMKPRGGSFGTYMSTLKTGGFIQDENGLISATQIGIDYLGEQPNPPQTSEEIIAMWQNNLQGGARRMFDALIAVYPNGYSKDELGNASEIMPTGGSFGTYLSILRSNGLVETINDQIKITDHIFNL